METRHYIVTLSARATYQVWVEATTAHEARRIAEAGGGKPHAPWKPDATPRTRKVERV